MNIESNETKNHRSTGAATWGPLLFYGALLAVLAFFWWLLIYSGGVSAP